ncbi:CAR11-like protein, partial [Mya arenaria]
FDNYSSIFQTPNLKMADQDDDEHYEILQEHFYLLSRYLLPEDFLDALLSHNVINIDEKELIMNQYVNQNRRQRANKFIEILMTKGARGYKKFVELLEYRCPHVYEELTGNKPRDPPSDRWMKKAYDHSERENELKDLNQELRIKYDELQQKQAESQNLPHQPQPPQKHPDLPSTVQTRIGQHIAEQKNILQDQVAELQMHSEELTKRFQNSDEECRKLNEKVSELKREVFTLSSIKRTLEKQKKNADKQCDLYHAQIMEKGTEIVELQTQRIQDTRRLHDLQQQKNRWIDEKHEAEKENQRLRNEIDLLRCQIRSSGSSQAGSSKNKSKIFTRKVQIQKQYSGEKFAEILAQQRQQKAQRKMSTETPAEDNKDLTDVQKASTLPSFAKESPEDLFNKEVAWFRYSRNDYATNKPRLEQSDSMIPHLKSEDSDPNVFVGPSVLQPSEIVTDFPCLEVDKDLFPKAITVIKKPGLPEKAMNIFRDIKFPVFGEKRLEIIGGNHTGFFISKVNFETQNFSTADKILCNVKVSNHDDADPFSLSPACVKLPVYIVCHDEQLATALLGLLSKSLPPKDFVVDVGGFHGNFESTDLNRRELSLPDIANREELVDKFKSCINSAQRRILWLTESELDPEVVKSNCSYLIQDVTDMQTNIQQALSIIS